MSHNYLLTQYVHLSIPVQHGEVEGLSNLDMQEAYFHNHCSLGSQELPQIHSVQNSLLLVSFGIL